jgi:type III secretory pathway component EscU
MGKGTDHFMSKFIDRRNIKSSIVMNNMLDDLLWFSFDLIIESAVSLAKSCINSCAFEQDRLCKFDKLPTIRLFISCTALLVNVMAKMLRYASFFFATRIIFKYSLQAHKFYRNLRMHHIAKDGLTIPDFQKERESKLDLLYVPN